MAFLNFFDCWEIVKQQKEISPVQFYYGYYEFLADMLIKKIVREYLLEKNDFNYRHFYFDEGETLNWQDVLDFVRAPSFFLLGKKVALVTIRKLKGLELSAEARSSLSAYFNAPNENALLIFHLSLDLLKDDYKQLKKGKLKNFFALFPQKSWNVDLDQFSLEQLKRFLVQYAQDNAKKISPTALGYLLEQFETDPLQLIAQMPKFLTASSDKNLEIEELSELICGVSSYYIWDLSEAIEQENGEKYLSVLNYLFNNGVNSTLIIGNLIFYYQRIFIARFLMEKGYQMRDIARLFNQERFLEKFSRTVRSFSIPKIKDILKNLERLDFSCKRGSEELARIYLQSFIFNLYQVRKQIL